jgi:hypothetical protein
MLTINRTITHTIGATHSGLTRFSQRRNAKTPYDAGLIKACSATSLLCLALASTAQELPLQTPSSSISRAQLASQLEVGDVVFIRVGALPFKKVASATLSWTNHVGVVIAQQSTEQEAQIAESTFPFSKTTSFSHFVARSEGGRVEVSRLTSPLSAPQKLAIQAAAQKRLGIFYDTGFNLHSKRQFCSRYVREVIKDASDINLGEPENFTSLLSHNPELDLSFWRLWYFGNIPWQRITVSPASLLRSPALRSQFDGVVHS